MSDAIARARGRGTAAGVPLVDQIRAGQIPAWPNDGTQKCPSGIHEPAMACAACDGGLPRSAVVTRALKLLSFVGDPEAIDVVGVCRLSNGSTDDLADWSSTLPILASDLDDFVLPCPGHNGIRCVTCGGYGELRVSSEFYVTNRIKLAVSKWGFEKWDIPENSVVRRLADWVKFPSLANWGLFMDAYGAVVLRAPAAAKAHSLSPGPASLSAWLVQVADVTDHGRVLEVAKAAAWEAVRG